MGEKYETIKYITIKYITIKYITIKYITIKDITIKYITIKYITQEGEGQEVFQLKRIKCSQAPEVRVEYSQEGERTKEAGRDMIRPDGSQLRNSLDHDGDDDHDNVHVHVDVYMYITPVDVK